MPCVWMRTCWKPLARALRARSGRSRRRVTSEPVSTMPFQLPSCAFCARMRSNCSMDSGLSQSMVPSIMQCSHFRLHLKCIVTSTYDAASNMGPALTVFPRGDHEERRVEPDLPHLGRAQAERLEALDVFARRAIRAEEEQGRDHGKR